MTGIIQRTVEALEPGDAADLDPKVIYSEINNALAEAVGDLAMEAIKAKAMEAEVFRQFCEAHGATEIGITLVFGSKDGKLSFEFGVSTTKHVPFVESKTMKEMQAHSAWQGEQLNSALEALDIGMHATEITLPDDGSGWIRSELGQVFFTVNPFELAHKSLGAACLARMNRLRTLIRQELGMADADTHSLALDYVDQRRDIMLALGIVEKMEGARHWYELEGNPGEYSTLPEACKARVDKFISQRDMYKTDRHVLGEELFKLKALVKAWAEINIANEEEDDSRAQPDMNGEADAYLAMRRAAGCPALWDGMVVSAVEPIKDDEYTAGYQRITGDDAQAASTG